MNEPGPSAAPAAIAAGGAGALLRDARQAQGLHVAALAAAIKVPQAKLEALEAERFDELPDATFARALAQSMCRALKIDPAPILARLPSAGPLALDKVEGGLNTPFRDRPGRIDPLNRAWLSHPVTWLVLALLLGAVAVAFVPTDWLRSVTGSVGAKRTADAATAESVPAFPPGSASAPMLTDPPERAYTAAVAATADAAASSPAAATTAAAIGDAQASATVAAAPSASTSGSPDAVLQIHATEATWVQVSVPGGKVVYSRLVPAGETAGIDVNPPLKVRIGNAKGTELRLRGQVVDLAGSVRGNTATIDLR